MKRNEIWYEKPEMSEAEEQAIDNLRQTLTNLSPLLKFETRIQAETLLKFIALIIEDGTLNYYKGELKSLSYSPETWMIKGDYYPDTYVKYWHLNYTNAYDNLPF